jgi:renal tumor antigen
MNYDMKTQIGAGTFSDVWLCVKRDNGKEMAAKILKKGFRSSKVNVTTLNNIAEVKIAKTVENHPFLLMMVGAYFYKECGKIVLVSELMKKSLFDIIRSGCSLSLFRIKIYTYQMLEGNNINILYFRRGDQGRIWGGPGCLDPPPRNFINILQMFKILIYF